MALIPCPECGRQVSTQAVACPACGCPITGRGPAPQPGANAGLLGRLAALLGAWLIVPHVARLIAIVVFCIMAGFMFYLLFAGAR
ncbi:zinc ribbon domain-containing protein [Xylophilus sp. ASV27]|uniref:zinc ribbon domain-containing protein n=1 Tax=Xylophilus sp. ASV27 TaxID=2795129 RepID=UPI0018EDE888|nr:zinc ribbon domain-containing protein [Xylophilus sp. ASV27]